MMKYSKFFIMMIISFIIMYLVMFLNLSDISHYQSSLSRIYMSLLMVTPMAVVMMLMMGKMYPDKKKNMMIISGSVILFSLVLIALRTQTPVKDVQYMKAMIPHHSSAIMTSRNAELKDPEVKKLASEIIAAQEKEIAEMKRLIDKLK